ncbi:MAG: DUF4335 domain-containing protein [Chroococcales cyanobacterium]
MPTSVFVIRRYTPPTCSLTITGQRSPLSRWTGQPLVKEIQFELALEDPTQPESKPIEIRGDRTQLELLNEVVSNYVQNFLGESGKGGKTLIQTGEENGSTELNASETPETAIHTTTGLVPFPMRQDVRELRIEPNGLLKHSLFLGPLASNPSEAEIHLSVVQLYDVASALEEYSADIAALPEMGSPGLKKTPSLWIGSAAAVVAALGITAVASWVANPPVMETATSLDETEESLEPSLDSNQANLGPSIGIDPVPLPRFENAPQPSPTLPSDLKSLEILTPPQAVQRPPAPTLNESPSLPSLPTSPSTTAQRPSITISPNPPQSAPNSPRTTAQRPSIAIAPNPPQSQPSSPSPTTRQADSRPLPTPSPLSSAPSTISPSPTQLPDIAANPSPTPTLMTTPVDTPRLSDLPPLQPKPTTDTEIGIAPETFNLEIPATSSSRLPITEANGNSTAIASLPQVGEIKNYFQDKWQPPENLSETLEYRLVLNSNGSIQRIIPLGEAAGTYIDRTNMPLIGEPFVSAIDNSKQAQIRLVLSPDGSVKTFLESD